MKYENIVKGTFISRPNRFIANVEIDGKIHTVHVKNTGRCRELLIPGVDVYLEESANPARKTKYDLVTVRKGDVLINMDSSAPNKIAEEWIRCGNLFSESAEVRREVTWGASRFDLYAEDGTRRAFIEVKGVTLEKDGIAYFPDAPTERGVKHVLELESAVREGYEAYLLFIVQMANVTEMRPNDVTHKAFGDAVRQAAENGVKVLALGCNVTADTVTATDEVKVVLNK